MSLRNDGRMERPILFSGPLVRAILEGRKTETRRPVARLSGLGPVSEFKRSDTRGYDFICRDQRLLWNDFASADVLNRCPYGLPGDLLWVRETCGIATGHMHDPEAAVRYFSDGAVRAIHDERAREHKRSCSLTRKVPSIHMPRWASRLLLRVKSVRIERVQDIDENGAIAEGFGSPCNHKNPARWDACEDFPNTGHDYPPVLAFMEAWQMMYSKGAKSWESNPYVWVVSFGVEE